MNYLDTFRIQITSLFSKTLNKPLVVQRWSCECLLSLQPRRLRPWRLPGCCLHIWCSLPGTDRRERAPETRCSSLNGAKAQKGTQQKYHRFSETKLNNYQFWVDGIRFCHKYLILPAPQPWGHRTFAAVVHKLICHSQMFRLEPRFAPVGLRGWGPLRPSPHVGSDRRSKRPWSRCYRQEQPKKDTKSFMLIKQ